MQMPTTPKLIRYKDHLIHLAEPSNLPDTKFVPFRGADRALRMARVAWGINVDKEQKWKIDDTLLSNGEGSFNFRLEGQPGVGKNEIVYEIARHLALPYFSIVGHEEMTPEDLILSVVPKETGPAVGGKGGFSMVLRASPLATALLTGGIFFFDELNRAPARTLSPLAPLLDDRRQMFSAIIETWIGRAEKLNVVDAIDEHIMDLEPYVPRPFFFCSALNHDVGIDLPEYIAQRTLPRIIVDNPTCDEMVQIAMHSVGGGKFINTLATEFKKWWSDTRPISVREALTLFRLADRILTSKLSSEPASAFRDAVKVLFTAREVDQDRKSTGKADARAGG